MSSTKTKLASLLVGGNLLIGTIVYGLTVQNKELQKQQLSAVPEGEVVPSEGSADVVPSEVNRSELAVESAPENATPDAPKYTYEKVEITTEPIELPKEEPAAKSPDSLPGPIERSRKRIVRHEPPESVARQNRPEPKVKKTKRYRKMYVYRTPRNRYPTFTEMMQARYDRKQNYEGYKARFGRY